MRREVIARLPFATWRQDDNRRSPPRELLRFRIVYLIGLLLSTDKFRVQLISQPAELRNVSYLLFFQHLV